MKHRILVFLAFICALSLICAASGASKPQKGNALLLGTKKGKVQIFIREVDGALVGDLPFKPAYQQEVAAGVHRIQPFCIVNESWGQQMGPAVVIEQEFLEGRVYQLEYASKERDYLVRVTEVASKKK